MIGITLSCTKHEREGGEGWGLEYKTKAMANTAIETKTKDKDEN
jgi:hypothetical protein